MNNLLTIFTGLMMLTISVVADQPAEQPDIIVIMVDDMGFSDVGCYGSEIPTPHLDALATDGLRFSQFYNTGRCCPTRASLLTGLYPHQTGMGWMTTDFNLPGYGGQLNDQCHTVAEVLGKAGYLTAITGKWHVGYSDSVNPTARGFQRSLNLEMGGVHFSNQTGKMKTRKLHLNGEEIAKDDPRLSPPWYGTDLWTEWGIKFLDQAIADEKPYFLYLAHVAPHFPCMAPEETIAKYRGKYMTGWDQLAKSRHEKQIELGIIDPAWQPTARPEVIPAWDSLEQKSKIRYDDMMAIYAAMIEELDKSVGKLVAALKQRNRFDNTLILFLTDNGGNAEAGIKGRYDGDNPGDAHSNVFIGQCWAHLNNTPFRKYKHYNHEGGIASPLIAHWPLGITSDGSANFRKSEYGLISDQPTHIIDLMATVVDLGSAKYPKQRQKVDVFPMRGTSWRPIFEGERLETRPLYWEHEGHGAIRVGDEKLVRTGIGGKWELYDLKQDRTEQKDLAAKNPDKVAALKQQFSTWARGANVIPRPEKLKAKKNKKNKKK